LLILYLIVWHSKKVGQKLLWQLEIAVKERRAKERDGAVHECKQIHEIGVIKEKKKKRAAFIDCCEYLK
jgi:hypothetical protein